MVYSMKVYYRNSLMKFILYLFFSITLLFTVYNMWDRNMKYTVIFAVISLAYYYIFTIYKREYVMIDNEEIIFYQGLKRMRFALDDLIISKISKGSVELTDKAENKKYSIYLSVINKKDAAALLNDLKNKIELKLPKGGPR